METVSKNNCDYPGFPNIQNRFTIFPYLHAPRLIFRHKEAVMSFYVVKRDIVSMKTDAIVNAANPRLLEGGGVCGAIFAAAGADTMRTACAALAPIGTGDAVLTPGFQLPAKWVIHTAGPVYEGGASGEAALLRRSYKECLKLARSHHMKSIAFPLISAEIYGYPREEAFQIAEETINDFLKKYDMEVYLCLYPEAPGDISIPAQLDDFLRTQGILPESPIPPAGANACFELSYRPEETDSAALDAQKESVRYSLQKPETTCEERICADISEDLRHIIKELDAPFSEKLLRLIDAKGMTDPEVYNAAYIDRRLFNKMKSPNYRPRKDTVLALVFGLRLTLEEANELLCAAGYALTPASKTDMICTYFLTHHMYDVAIVNSYLLDYDQKPLGYNMRNA